MTLHIKLFVATALLFLSAQQSKGFALLGPYADWMQPTNGFRVGDIGGPMDLGEEYRWNVPLLTYGFDQTFLDYFGSNGVAAVEQAFQILNDVPTASSINLENYSSNFAQISPSSQSQDLLDLKTITLSLILEQLGLAQPTRSVFVLRQWDPLFETFPDEPSWPEGTIPANILERNFDPESLLPSHSVNDSLFSGEVFRFSNADYTDVFETLIDPTDQFITAVADSEHRYGQFFMGLSSDDAGGLRYLLRTNNVNFETLLDDVHGVTTNQIYVNAAMRPGVNKTSFVRQQFDSPLQQWIPVTNQFTDIYFSNSNAMEQTLERITRQPDFLFCAGDTGQGKSFSPLFLRSGTTNWWNSDSLEPLGPGVIHPPIKFVFDEFKTTISTDDHTLPFGLLSINHPRWSSFNETTNVILYPSVDFSETNQFTVRFRLFPNSDTFVWHPALPHEGIAALQTSTNLDSWTTITTVTNLGSVIQWNHRYSDTMRFFRVISE